MRARTSIAATVAVAVAIAAAGVLMVVVVDGVLSNSVEQSVVQRSRDVAAQLASSGVAVVQPILDAAPNDSTLIQVLYPSRRVGASSSTIAGEHALSSARPAAGSTEVSQVVVPFVDGEIYLVAATGVKLDNRVLTVIAAQSLHDVQRTRDLVAVLLLVGGPLLVIAAGFVTWLAVGKSLNGVDQISVQVEAISARELSQRVPVPPANDEIHRLAITMNHMLGRLESSAASQRRFIADASHELKSPLASMRASIDVARVLDSIEDWKSTAPILDDEVTRMTKLVADLLLLAKADEDQIKLRPALADLDDIVRDEAARLRAQTSFAVTCDCTPVQMLCDGERVAQGLRNLVDNAAGYAEKTVRISCSVRAGSAIICVEDDGPGIPEDMRAAAVRRFVRLDEHRARNSGGSGLGLSIVREIARLHGGELTLGSSTLGGLQISIELPLLATADSVATSL